ASGLLGISAVTVTAVLMSLNPGMYLVLLGKDISEMEESAFSVINLLMLPAIPLVILSVGESHIPLLVPLLANILPFVLGIVIGYLYPSSRIMFRPLSILLIPFLAVTFGARINMLMALKASFSGLLLVLFYYLIAVLPLLVFDRYWNDNGGRMALSMSSIAAFSMSIPPFVSQYMPLSEKSISQSISQIAFAVILSSFITPYLYKKWIPSRTDNPLDEKVYQLTLDHQGPQFLLEAMAAIDWKAGAYLVKRLQEGELDPKDRIVVITDDSDQLKGFAALLSEDIVENPGFGPFLATVYVAPAFRGKGLSLELVDRILEVAKADGFSELYTLTQHEGLYEKSGFQFIRQTTDKFGRSMRLLKKRLL
ncbi:GNAT family N-acetyltransferase, partial [Streptococcus ictaluri]